MSVELQERLSFNTLYRLSEPRRKVRAQTVSGPPLKLDTFNDQMMWSFNFKSAPSTTGLRHHGYIRFFKPSRPKQLQQLDCVLDCTCPDYKYRWAWANKQRGSSFVGPRSLNQAWNQAPRVTNPTGRPGLCKHLLALKDYIYGVYSSFTRRDREYTDQAMDKLVKYAQNRWINMPAELERARQRDQRAAAVRAARNRGQPEPEPLVTAVPDEPVDTPQVPEVPATEVPAASAGAQPPRRPPLIVNRQANSRPDDLERPGRGLPQESSVLRVGMKTQKRLSADVERELTEARRLLEQCQAAPGAQPPPVPSDDGSEGPEALALLRAVADNTGRLADLIQQLIPSDDADKDMLDVDLDQLGDEGGEDDTGGDEGNGGDDDGDGDGGNDNDLEL